MPQEFHLSAESAKLKKSIVDLLQSRPPTKKYVAVQFYINRVFKVDDVNESVSLDFYLKLNWISDLWKGKTDDEFQEDENRFDANVWWEPGVEVTNGIELTKMIEKEEAFWLEYPDEGVLAYTQRFIGSISAPMDLHDFPFDSQCFTINFESFHWKESDCSLLRLPTHACQYPPKQGERWITMSNEVRLSEWKIEMVQVNEELKHYDFEDRTYSQVQVSVSITRKYGYYLSKLMSILGLIVLMCWTSFLIPPDQLSDRVSIAVTLFLSAVAFNFVGSASIPKVSYLTQFDKYLIVCYVMIVTTVIENMISYMYFTYVGPGGWFVWANPVDAISLGLFPLAFVAINVVYIGQILFKKKGPRSSSKGVKLSQVQPIETSSEV